MVMVDRRSLVGESFQQAVLLNLQSLAFGKGSRDNVSWIPPFMIRCRGEGGENGAKGRI